MKPNKIDKALDSTLDALYNRASFVIEQARETAYRQINEALVKRNWELGKLIAEEELNGQDRAIYGAAIIKDLSKRLTANFGKGFTKTKLYSYSQFDKVYPEIFHAVSGKSGKLFFTTTTIYLHRNTCFRCPPPNSCEPKSNGKKPSISSKQTLALRMNKDIQ